MDGMQPSVNSSKLTQFALWGKVITLCPYQKFKKVSINVDKNRTILSLMLTRSIPYICAYFIYIVGRKLYDHILGRISQWACENLVEFNATKIQVCAFSAKKSLFFPLPTYQCTQMPLRDRLAILGMEFCPEIIDSPEASESLELL